MSQEQENRQFKNATCRGAYAFGTACGHCERCDIDPLNPKNAVKETTVQQEGKDITTTEHPSGRKDVHIEVSMLDVKETDEATTKAKQVIEEKVLPKLADADVLVIVVHKHSHEHAERVVKLPHVRAYAEAVLKSYRERDPYAQADDFIVVEHHITNNSVKVSTLV